MSKDKIVNPIGSDAAEARRRRTARSSAYRAQQADLAPFGELAWLLIEHRMQRGLSQKALADLVGTSHSQISRIESGRHKTNFETLRRIARALDLKLIVGFEDPQATGRTKRRVVVM